MYQNRREQEKKMGELEKREHYNDRRKEHLCITLNAMTKLWEIRIS